MFSARIIVQPTSSEAVARLEWDSVNETLYVQYTSSDSAYSETEVDYDQFAALCGEANRLGSWGSALHHWKRAREEAFYIRDRNAFDELARSVHPATLERFAKWAQEEVQSRTLTARVSRRR